MRHNERRPTVERYNMVNKCRDPQKDLLVVENLGAGAGVMCSPPSAAGACLRRSAERKESDALIGA